MFLFFYKYFVLNVNNVFKSTSTRFMSVFRFSECQDFWRISL